MLDSQVAHTDAISNQINSQTEEFAPENVIGYIRFAS